MHLAAAGAAAVAIAWSVLSAGTVSAAPARTHHPAKTAAGAAGAEADKSPVDINAADSVKLTELPGIGPALAQRIVDYRKEHGPFKSIDELVNVRGVGERLLERLRDRLTIGPKA
jgi:competence protein ComEA